MDERAGRDEDADGPLAWALWSSLFVLGRVAGPIAARTIAAAVLRVVSPTPAGYRRSMLRVAHRTPHQLPRLTRLPMAWWSHRPLVRVRRLGTSFDLDLRDNLQRTLYVTGRYGDADAGVRSQFTVGTIVASARVVPLDDWAELDRLDRLDILKIDVEGAEPDVLAGAARSLHRYRPRLVLVEVKERILARAGADAEAVRRPLREAGYRCDGAVDGNEVWRAA